MPSLNDVFLGDPRLFFIRDRESDRAACFEWDPSSDDETLVMRNEQTLTEDGMPFTTRLEINRRDYQPLATEVTERSEAGTTYALRHEPREETGENYRLTFEAFPGPQGKDQTYYGTFRDLEAEKEYDVFAVVDANTVCVW